MRGKEDALSKLCYRGRITPAYAGKSFVQHLQSHLYTGSPPPMRGKGGLLWSCCRFAGITPAYAGKSMYAVQSMPRERDHPRLCGEKSLLARIRLSKLGSPPPMRGKDCRSADNVQRVRITPAYAGKSQQDHGDRQYLWDHPRLCGEKPPEAPAGCCPAGSPPPMRGKEFCVKQKHFAVGITPAYAGKSHRKLWIYSFRKDHPRLCGEKKSRGYVRTAKIGSPPPMRGKADEFLSQFRNLGITPAYAGKS